MVGVMELYGTIRLGAKFRDFMELYKAADGMEQLPGMVYTHEHILENNIP